jgi:hypothetical protein
MEIVPDNGEAVPFVFVVPESPGTAIETLRTLEVNRDWQQFLRGPWIWCLQTYQELRKLGCPVVLANKPAPGCVNLIHVRQLHRLRLKPNTFAVSIQADCPDVAPWTPVNIVQNRRQEDRQRSFWIPHWPQPGLIPRSPERNHVKCAAYTGNDDWLAGTERQWSRALGSLGIVFRYLGNDSWNDYSTIDVLIVIRSFDQSAYDFKPPTKLINAWHGQLPLVAGLDSAFS